MLRERLSLAIRRRLPGNTSEVDPTHLLAQLPTEDVINSGRLIASIKRDLPDQDLGFKAKPAWEALAEAKKAQVREPQHDFSEIIGQAQLQHGYALSREMDADIKRANRNRVIKDVVWAATIVGPIFEGLVALVEAANAAADELDRREYLERKARIEAQYRADRQRLQDQ